MKTVNKQRLRTGRCFWRYAIIMRILLIFTFLISGFSFACDEYEKPKLTLEKGPMKERKEKCGAYFIVLPKHYKDEILNGVTIRLGKEFAFNLAVGDHKEESKSVAIVCAKSEWFKGADLTVNYVPAPEKNGGLSLCASYYDYSNLYQYLEP